MILKSFLTFYLAFPLFSIKICFVASASSIGSPRRRFFVCCTRLKDKVKKFTEFKLCINIWLVVETRLINECTYSTILLIQIYVENFLGGALIPKTSFMRQPKVQTKNDNIHLLVLPTLLRYA